MFSGVATIIIALAYRISRNIRGHRTPHVLVFIPWLAYWIMFIIAVVKIGQLNSAARCSPVDEVSGPWCTGSGDVVMIGVYIVTVIAFLEGYDLSLSQSKAVVLTD
jgi:hypothetical protein